MPESGPERRPREIDHFLVEKTFFHYRRAENKEASILQAVMQTRETIIGIPVDVDSVYLLSEYDTNDCICTHLDESGPSGGRKQGTPRCLRLRNACSVSLASDAGSMRQNEPLPGSSWERGTLTKYRFSERL